MTIKIPIEFNKQEYLLRENGNKKLIVNENGKLKETFNAILFYDRVYSEYGFVYDKEPYFTSWHVGSPITYADVVSSISNEFVSDTHRFIQILNIQTITLHESKLASVLGYVVMDLNLDKPIKYVIRNLMDMRNLPSYDYMHIKCYVDYTNNI